MDYRKLKYEGKALTPEEQIQLLKNRGIQIQDNLSVSRCLCHVGFYRLSAYIKPLLEANSPIQFEQVWDLYIFDRKLRLLVMDAVERIEIAFRVSISEVMSSRYGPLWYLEANNFANIKWHLEFMEKVVKLAETKNQLLIKHYYETYSYPEFPPSWIIIECLTFGTWSKVFNNLKNRNDKKTIAARMGQPFRKLESWIRCLTDTRNLCAHHERLWNHIFTYCPQNAPNDKHQFQRFYQQAYIICKLLKEISSESDWQDKFKALLREHNLPVQQMGFQSDWQNDPFWSY